MKLYTRSGDDGRTGLFSGDRVGKDHPRIEAYGTVDELNACLGLAVAAIEAGSVFGDTLRTDLLELQSRCFDLGADLATPEGARNAERIGRFTDEDVDGMESMIDRYSDAAPEIRCFVLPGGTELAARLHLCRTVCRRAERLMVHLGHGEPVTPQAIRWINRLSDLLFAMSRAANHAAGVPDVPWQAK
jgi:cob(I)alamin adenosyltransferase